MSKPLKYFLLLVIALGVFIFVAGLSLTALVDVNSYKPRIEQLVSKKTGYPLHLGGDISLSLFPWVGLDFTELTLANPQGFTSGTFITIDSFQARLKLLPLLSRQVEISRFVVKQPEIFLEKSAKGIWNWENLLQGNKTPVAAAGQPTAAAAAASDKSPLPQKTSFTLRSLIVGEFSILNGRIQIRDAANSLPHELSDISLQLVDVSLDKPIKLSMAAAFDGKPLKVAGTVGPLGHDPGTGRINLDLTIQALDLLYLKAAGSLEDIKRHRRYTLALTLQPFSPQKLFAALDRPFPLTPADPQVLQNLGVKGTIEGDARQLALSAGTLLLDDSTITGDMTVKDFSRPDLALNMAVDSLNLDRYLPATATVTPKVVGEQGPIPTGAVQAAGTAAAEKSPVELQKKNTARDYAPLRKLLLQAKVHVAEMQVHGGRLRNLAVNVTGMNGIYTVHSLAIALYDGKIDGTGRINVQQAIPATELKLLLHEVQIGPLLHDFAGKDLIEGRLSAQFALSAQGDAAAEIKKTLNGQGELHVFDGALLGIDLAQLARTIKTGFSLTQQQGDKPKTDFAELQAPFTIRNGLLNTEETLLRSPFIRVSAAGDVDLVSETLDMQLKPTLVGTIKGQGDEELRAGLSVPVLVSGTFRAPQFTPDLEGLVKDQMLTQEEIQEIIKTGKIPPQRKEKFKEDLEQAKGLLKGLFGK